MPRKSLERKQPVNTNLPPRVRALVVTLAERANASQAEIFEAAIVAYASSKGLSA